MPGAGAARELGAILVAGALVAGCAGAMPSPASTSPAAHSPASRTASPASTGTTTVCPPPPAGASPAPAEPRAWPGLNAPAGLSAAVEAETAELMAAIGNPDTGSGSPAWDAFDASLGSSDAATIRANADVVIGHLQAACAAVASYFEQPGAAPWAADVRGLLDGLAGVVVTLRDAATRHDEPMVAAGRDAMQAVLLDHFYQSFKMSDPEAWQVRVPDRAWSATASHVRWITGEVGAAFDGQRDTKWLAGDVGLPQWIEVDFGAELAVAGIRLLTYQESDGATDHRVTARTATGRVTELARFAGSTRDGQWLELTLPTAVERIRYVRVTTSVSPSMLGWREVEVILAAGSSPGPCAPSTAAVTNVTKTSAGPQAGSDPGLAVDGDESTGWDPGPVRGVEGARGWMRVWFAGQVRISEVRVLLGPGSAAARYEVVLFPPGELGTSLGTLGPVPAGGGWVTLAGPNPCLPYESVYVFVRSEEPAGVIREIRVIGTTEAAAIDERAAHVLAMSEVPLNGLRGAVDTTHNVIAAGVRTSETNLGDLVADAMLWEARRRAGELGVDGPQVALLNGGAIRNDSEIAAGQVTELNAVEILPFPDYVSVKEDISAKVFKAILETSVSEIGNPRFGQWAGVTFSYDPTAPGQVIDPETCVVSEPGSRVRDVRVGDTRVFDDGAFVGPAGWTVDLAALDYTLRGGDCYAFGPGDFTATDVAYQQALVDYLVAPTAEGGLGAMIAAGRYPAGGEGRIVRLP